MKKGIRYLRFSSDGQSLHSIERQDLITSQWMNNSGVEIVDTFIDEGHTVYFGDTGPVISASMGQLFH